MVLEQLAVLNAKLEDSTRSSRTEHSTPTQEELGMYALDERNECVNYVANNPNSNAYNPGWKNHPNLSYKSNSVENPASNNFRFLQSQEKTNQEFRAQFASIEAHFKNIDNQIAQLASAIQRPSGSLPGNSETNPRAHVNAITLKSGKQVDSRDPPMVEQGDSSRTTVLDTADDTPEPAYVPPPPRPPPVPFPSRLRKHNEDSQFAKFVEMLKKLEIPSYTKYLKDILTKKRVTEKETVALTAECSALIRHELPLKRSDPGAAVSLLPLSIFKKLNVGELKPTRMTLQLADRSVKYPIGILEDVPLIVGNFYIPVEFVVLDMDEDPKVEF
ncbi:PREDICTED: uncharacterized protein LOC104800358 [Tarenaya hassleriana]|uniref:uncharacterized protein LOC104800358 n=1 Tax=Tarenaya hassleriana TaxID=28532 RepID=UPI00053C4B9F|nr:PREDICTED: uncharacterized protein LOC104800358 [Tarenaya hassleriana]